MIHQFVISPSILTFKKSTKTWSQKNMVMRWNVTLLRQLTWTSNTSQLVKRPNRDCFSSGSWNRPRFHRHCWWTFTGKPSRASRPTEQWCGMPDEWLLNSDLRPAPIMNNPKHRNCSNLQSLAPLLHNYTVKAAISVFTVYNICLYICTMFFFFYSMYANHFWYTFIFLLCTICFCWPEEKAIHFIVHVYSDNKGLF